MAGKVRVNGTNYSITGGKCRVNGTNYSIKKGRARVSGTNYDIVFSSECRVTVILINDYMFGPNLHVSINNGPLTMLWGDEGTYFQEETFVVSPGDVIQVSSENLCEYDSHTSSAFTDVTIENGVSGYFKGTVVGDGTITFIGQ